MPASTTSSLRSLGRRPVADWLLLAEAGSQLVWAKIKLHLFPFAQIAPGLGSRQAETLKTVSEEHRRLASKISWAVLTGARYLPLRLVCLPQALAAGAMLARRGVASTLYLGVRLDKVDAFTAHAWLRTGSKWVTGNDARRGQTTVGCFARTTRRRSGWRAGLAVIVMSALLTLTLMPVPPLQEANEPGQPGLRRDLGHAMGQHDFAFNLTGMLAVTLLLNFAVYTRYRAPARYRWQLATTVCLLVALLECSQLLLPHRNFDSQDILAGALGVLIATLPWTRPSWR